MMRALKLPAFARLSIRSHGVRWSLNGCEAVLRLRVVRASGDFDAYWQATRVNGHGINRNRPPPRRSEDVWPRGRGRWTSDERPDGAQIACDVRERHHRSAGA